MGLKFAEENIFTNSTMAEYIPSEVNSLPSGIGITYFHLPPTLKLCSTTLIFIPFGPHHWAICSGCVHASQTNFTGALKVLFNVNVRLLISLDGFIFSFV